MARHPESTLQLVAAALFAAALLHTFAAKQFERLAHRFPRHAGVFHLLGEVEAVFGFWALILVITVAVVLGSTDAVHYLEGLNYTEPMFVFVIMVVAASKPILNLAKGIVAAVANFVPMQRPMAFYFVLLSLVPLFLSMRAAIRAVAS